jgi:hypothetical protein
MADASLVRATGAARDAKAEDLAADHSLPDVFPGGGDRVHLLADAERLCNVIRVGRCGLGFQAKSALPSPVFRGFVEREPDRFGVAVALVSQNREVLLGTLIKSSLYRPRHRRSVPQNVVQLAG